MIRGMRHVRRLALLIALVATTATTAAASPRVVVREGLRYKPHELALSGDGDLLARHLRWRSCSTRGLRPAGVTRSITARGESCATARRLVHAWFQKLKVPNSQCVVPDGQPGPAVCAVGHWRCTSPHTVNGATYPVTCVSHAGRRRVHFVNRV
jgi:hypothetical protein